MLLCPCVPSHGRGKTPPEGIVEYEGYMKKRGSTKWHRYLRRYFQVRERFLVYFRHEDDAAEGKALGWVDLCGVQITSNNDCENGIYLMGRFLDHDYCIQAPNQNSKRVWCSVLLKSITQHTTPENLESLTALKQLDSIRPDHSIATLTGYLFKKGRHFGKYSGNYYQLQGPYLFYSKLQAMKPYKMLYLKNATAAENNDKALPSSFTVTGPHLSRTYTFVPKSDSERQRWVLMINSCGVRSPSSSPTPTPKPLPSIPSRSSSCDERSVRSEDEEEAGRIMQRASTLLKGLPRMGQARDIIHISLLEHTCDELEKFMLQAGWFEEGERTVRQCRQQVKAWRAQLACETESARGVVLMESLRNQPQLPVAGLQKWLSHFKSEFEEYQCAEEIISEAEQLISEQQARQREANLQKAKEEYKLVVLQREMRRDRVEVAPKLSVLRSCSGEVFVYREVKEWLQTFSVKYEALSENDVGYIKNEVGCIISNWEKANKDVFEPAVSPSLSPSPSLSRTLPFRAVLTNVSNIIHSPSASMSPKRREASSSASPTILNSTFKPLFTADRGCAL
eukprot:TRINITY_DN3334_c0_g4_i1.p1 TRINITY_DN3334_c0_g4~~TRINITY_DN3334_c0_g4_i1.p1  ORF type:complete len:565 (+),score=69.52 TRINITY_DN3334_c0_g4_i1:46-1740(+)